MIRVKPTDRGYYECHSCSNSKSTSGVEVYDVSVGLDDKDVSTFRLCIRCVHQLKDKLVILR